MKFVVVGTGAERDPDNAMKWVGNSGNALYLFELDEAGVLSQVTTVRLFVCVCVCVTVCVIRPVQPKRLYGYS